MATLLSLTQDILSEMSGDEVNSIFDTEEAEKIARIIIKTFDAIVARDTWPQNRRGTSLTARGDVNFPTHMSLPDNVAELISIRYDKQKSGDTRKLYSDVTYKYPDDFLRHINPRNSDDANTQVVTNDDGIELLILTNKAPDYYTSFNETDVVFDSFDSAVDTTLQESKTQALAYFTPVLELQDTSVIDLPNDAIPLLYEESLSRAQYKVGEKQDAKAEQEATRQRRSLSQKQWRVNRQTRYPNYGRKSNKNTRRNINYNR